MDQSGPKMPKVLLITPARLFTDALSRSLSIAGWPVSRIDPGPIALLRFVADHGDDTIVVVVGGGTVHPVPLAQELRRAAPGLRFVLVLAEGQAPDDLGATLPGSLAIGTDASVTEVVSGLHKVSGLAISSVGRELTSRHLEILQLVAEGCATDEVGERLGIAPKTVNNHLSAVYRRLKARNLTQAVLQASRAGLIDVNVVR